MELVKPLPLYLDGHAHYTLTSYGPASIVLDRLQTSDEDVELALQATVMRMGGHPGDVNDAWVRKTFSGLHGVDELRTLIKRQIADSDEQVLEEQKTEKCIVELTKRLVQSVPQRDINAIRESLVGALCLDLKEQNLTLDQFRIQSGMTETEMQIMFDEEARQAAEQEAALDALVDHYRLNISDEELASLIAGDANLSASDIDGMLRELKTNNQYNDARSFALRNLALRMFMDEARYTYRIETKEEAEQRRAQMRRELQIAADIPTKKEYPHLKLV